MTYSSKRFINYQTSDLCLNWLHTVITIDRDPYNVIIQIKHNYIVKRLYP